MSDITITYRAAELIAKGCGVNFEDGDLPNIIEDNSLFADKVISDYKKLEDNEIESDIDKYKIGKRYWIFCTLIQNFPWSGPNFYFM